jgi:hypothetical protein
MPPWFRLRSTMFELFLWWSRGTANTFYKELSSVWDSLRLFGLLEVCHSSDRDGLQFFDFAFASCHQYVGWLSEYQASEENWERCYEKRDIMMSIEIIGVTIPIWVSRSRGSVDIHTFH